MTSFLAYVLCVLEISQPVTDRVLSRPTDSCIYFALFSLQQKAKLHQECTLVIKDFEVSQTTIKEITVKLQNSERKSEEIAIKLKEMTNMFEKTDRDNKAR